MRPREGQCGSLSELLLTNKKKEKDTIGEERGGGVYASVSRRRRGSLTEASANNLQREGVKAHDKRPSRTDGRDASTRKGPRKSWPSAEEGRQLSPLHKADTNPQS